MDHIIDVVTCADRVRFRALWRSYAGALANRTGFRSAELFEMQRDVRDACYDFVAVYGWRAGAVAVHSEGERDAGPSAPGVSIERALYRLELQLADLADPEEGHVWLVNPFEITEEQIPDVLDMWDKAKDHMIAKPGFVNARLFRTGQAPFRFGLVNVAQWRSADFFLRALNDKAYDSHRERSLQYRLHSSLCTRAGLILPAPAGAEQE
ncbi:MULTISPECIES: antibiotic biosynthesis monooxygenase family protein [Azospirillum]|nr:MULTISPECIES: antibiotic biosynthesis monooxygenase [Azospirillum]ALJ38868.1 hypothetical protein AMK58_25540 [Azospirillum brasilense]MDW7557095.1 antibiotic biosynthesis monooxygenase [Azospirillum brasilense]MDW7596771.1 antibiotic biosynthesis monooxygenase [Azospirillum brasilense]MDW7631865.1 antibiotic biosynthesis monooxygenase [Azospirillum brasilense]MDX5950744.1 antibiotic biosynthesis monooxygenase [Azospirillum brasilense]